MGRLTVFLFGKNRADNYPGKGIFNRPKTLRRAEVNRKLCKGCSDCSYACYYGRIKVDKTGKAYVRRGCRGCALCSDVCPAGAISMIDII